MKRICLLLIVVALGLSASAWAQNANLLSPRSMGMGFAGIGLADDAGAWALNPAGLGALNLTAPEGNAWANDIIGAFGVEDLSPDSLNVYGLNWSGWVPQNRWGLGAGYMEIQDTGRVYGAGAGFCPFRAPLSVGASVLRADPESGDGETYFNVGGLYRFERVNQAPVRFGVVIRDVTGQSEYGPYFDAGVAWPITQRLLAVGDLTDITDESGEGVQSAAGLEWKVGRGYPWRLRGGVFDAGSDTGFSGGIGFGRDTWRIDVAYADMGDDVTLWSAGIGLNF